MNEILELGDTGDNVIILQEKLKGLGFYNAIITGSFDASTEEGVKAFQISVGLDSTGVVDSETWQRLVLDTTPAIAPISLFPTLSLGSTGQYVTDLQTKLKVLLYYTESINGNFDLETENSVKRFQLNNALTADGKVGNLTWNKINSLYGNLSDCAIQNDDGNNIGSDNGSGNNNYTVVSGDTLYSIARRYNTTVDAIKSLNDLTSNTLTVGQVLKIPTAADDGYVKYTVKNGDTLYSIARSFNTTVNEIKNLNNLTSDILRIGQILNIPTKGQDDYINYIVKSGDTLYSIAIRYNISVDTIKSLNDLTNNTLMIGQVLKIPTNAGTNYISYTVQSGDTLYSIARRYNVSVDVIKSLNNLMGNTLRVGQVIRIPV